MDACPSVYSTLAIRGALLRDSLGFVSSSISNLGSTRVEYSCLTWPPPRSKVAARQEAMAHCPPLLEEVLREQQAPQFLHLGF